MTDAIRMSHDRDPRVVLNISNQFIAASRNHQINELIEREQGGNLCSGLDRLDVGSG